MSSAVTGAGGSARRRSGSSASSVSSSRPGGGEIVEVQRDAEDVPAGIGRRAPRLQRYAGTFRRVHDLGLQPQLTGEVQGPGHPEQEGVGPFVHRRAGERRGVDLAAPAVGDLVDGDLDAVAGGQLPGRGQAG